jgi:hypothetical protein
MPKNDELSIQLIRYEEENYIFLNRMLGDPRMMKYLGGLEPDEKIQKRHKRYLQEQVVI